MFALKIIDFFFPPRCFKCSNPTESGSIFLCSECYAAIPLVSEGRLNIEYTRKFFEGLVVDRLYSLFVYDGSNPLGELIHSLKYKNQHSIGKYLGGILAYHYPLEIAENTIVVPVPVHKIRKLERGYNQSAMIAKPFAKELGLCFEEKALIKVRHLTTQTTKTLEERAENIKDSFKVKYSDRIKGKQIILIDDVITTGATVSECARVLLNAGAAGITAVSVGLTG